MSRELKDAISQLAGTFNRDFVSITACTVQTVDTTNRQCTCQPLNGDSDAVLTVNLSAEPNDGILVTPSQGSTVLVAQTVQNDPFVLMFSDIDGFSIVTNDGKTQVLIGSSGSVQLNDGSFGGLVQVGNLVTKLNNLENLVNSILSALKDTSIPLAPSGSYPFAPLYSAISSISPITEQADIENTLITHGK